MRDSTGVLGRIFDVNGTATWLETHEKNHPPHPAPQGRGLLPACDWPDDGPAWAPVLSFF